MEYTSLGRTGVTVSRVCLGTMMFGGPTNEADSIQILERGFENGVNFVDTANVYNDGESERIVGKAIKDRRDDIVLVSKVGSGRGQGPNQRGLSRRHIMSQVEQSLERLATDYLDVYLFHWPDRGCPIEESLRASDDLISQGKVRYAGCSNYHGYELVEALWAAERLSFTPTRVNQLKYNIVNRDAEVDVLPACHRFGVGTMVYSPLARGVLSGKYRQGEAPPKESRAGRQDRRIQETELREQSFDVAQAVGQLASEHGKTTTQLAINWVLGNGAVSAAVIGPRTEEQCLDNLGSVGWQIGQEALDRIDELVPPGEHTGFGVSDPQDPVLGRPQR